MNIQNLVHDLWAWPQTGGRWDASTVAIGGFAVACIIVLTIRRARLDIAPQRLRPATAGTSQPGITASDAGPDGT